ncbi:Uncharacterised protein (plasmid) [Legionella adelaidensis]|uniref:Transmembrane protein n=1 Tax=Legionella adelaidensis TaxID=45056 RepID=A0A0W0R3A5_9GAMM|nr:hypothetical protein [Legionella adelaidensis]KTC65539.1 hypothetical protein Lade_0197 [Legionella adelaidensis]VEH84640.1 Uncharacterised protein [Legionella adelaidensis]
MDREEEALSISNPRLLSAIYFSLLAIIITLAIDVVMYSLGIDFSIPLFKAILLAVIIAATFGALFGENIVHSPTPYKKHAFWWAFLMVMVAVPFYTLGFFILLKQHNPSLFLNATTQHLFYLYLLVLLYSFILAGVWLALFAGIAAIFLRGYLVNFLLRSLYVRRTSPTGITIGTKTPKYGQQKIDQKTIKHGRKPKQ